MIEEVNAGVPQPDFISIAEQNRNKQANFIYTRYLKDPDNSVECKILSFSKRLLIVKQKLKLNMGFLAFQKAKKIAPMKFEYRKNEKQQELSNNSAMSLKYSKFFKQNPDLIEFMKVTNKNDEKN